MPMVRFTSWDKRSELPADAVNLRVVSKAGHRPRVDYVEQELQQGPFIEYVTYDVKTGLCIKEWENNGYHDSDFFMLYWDEETQSPKTECFATTRGWSYPCLNSRVDATPEVLAKYRAWEQKRDTEIRARRRHNDAVKLQLFRKEVSRVAKEFEVSYPKLLKLRRATKLPAILELFGPRIRSKFKLSLREQVLNWLRDPSPKYGTPLTKKQMGYISE